MPYDLTPDQQYSYDSQRRSAMRSTASNLNALGRQTSNLDANYARDFNAATRTWDNARAAFPRRFNQRGIMTSGIYNREMQNFADQRTDAFGRLAQEYYNTRANMAGAADDYRANYEDMLGSINDQERMQMAQRAAALRGMA